MNDLIINGVEEKNLIILQGKPGEGSFYYEAPLNTLFDYVRGIKNTLIDIRRKPEKVQAACDAIWEQDENHKKANPADFMGRPFPFCCQGYHSECFLNPKQFEKYIMKYFLDGYGKCLEAGAKFYIKGEGHYLSILDFYKDLPKGSMIFMCDQDDPYDLYKTIGEYHSVATGITSDLLQFGTVDQCVNYVKASVDAFAPGGGFLFTPNKPLLCAQDTKIDNLIATYKTINEYGRK